MALQIVASCILASLFSNVWGVEQFYAVTLNEEYHFMGTSVTFQADSATDFPDLSDELIQFDNRARSACVYGMWIFYSKPYFNPEGCGDMEFIFSPNSTTCYNFPLPTGVATLSSLRIVGNPMDFRLPTLTVYQYVNFQGKELVIGAYSGMTDLRVFGHVGSIIITGDDNWTVYDQPNFQGNRWCLRVPQPGSFKPAFIQNLEVLIGYDKVVSIRRGCH